MLDVEGDRIAAKRAALSDSTLYHAANRKYGRHFETYRKDIPRALCIAHVLRVNRNLEDAPSTMGQSFKRGFPLASTSVAAYSDFSASDLDRPEIAAYVWCREVNRLARALYENNKSLFPASGEDFWKTTYLKHALGDYAFSQVWNLTTSLVAYGVHNALVYTVNGLKKAVTPWSATTIKKLVQYDCERVFALADIHGDLNSENYGTTPTLKKQAIL